MTRPGGLRIADRGAALSSCCWRRALAAHGAAANTPITSYSAVPSTTQAGGHPDVEVQFALKNRFLQQSQSPCNCEDAKDATVHLPAGFIGNPHATPQCTIADFSADHCPIDSQVGIVNVNRQAIGTFITHPSTTSSRRPTRPACSASRSSSSTRRSSPC